LRYIVIAAIFIDNKNCEIESVRAKGKLRDYVKKPSI
jgi:hypothetical protein